MIKKIIIRALSNPVPSNTPAVCEFKNRPKGRQKPAMTARVACSGVKRLLSGFFVLFALAGCQQVATVRLPDSAMTTMAKVVVVAVESPPLTVYPDLLETRMPVYRHFDDILVKYFLKFPSEEELYWLPGGIFTSGKVGWHDDVKEASFSGNVEKSEPGGWSAFLIPPYGNWSPSLALAKTAADQLNAVQLHASLNPRLLRLPMADKDRNANPAHWLDAVERWYGQRFAAVDYRRAGIETADAVLEVGLGQNSILAGQTSLQVLIKLIDPADGRVIAKTGREAHLLKGSAQSLLYPEGEGFKALINETGAELLAQGFQDIRLAQARLAPR